MEIHFRQVQPKDWEAIMKIENQGFSPAEAASRAAMKERIENIPETFIVAAKQEEILGYIVGPTFSQRYLTDELYQHTLSNNKSDAYQTVLSLAVARPYRHHKIGTQLLTQLAQVARFQKRQAITLTCLADLIPFYEVNGYINEGLSASQHADEKWYNMVKIL